MSSDNSVEVIGLDAQLTSPDISRIFVSQTDPEEDGTTLNDGEDVWVEAEGTGESTSNTDVEGHLEEEMHIATNDYRESQGLSPLSYRDDVAEVAQAHSQNMYEQDDLSHTLDGQDLSGRLDEAGITYSAAAENIAYESTEPIDGSQSQLETIAQSFVDSWVNSAGHRENIEADNEAEGVGVYIDGSNDIVWATAVFITT